MNLTSNSGLFGLHTFRGHTPPVLKMGCARYGTFVKCGVGRIRLSRKPCSLLICHSDKIWGCAVEAPSCFSKNLLFNPFCDPLAPFYKELKFSVYCVNYLLATAFLFPNPRHISSRISFILSVLIISQISFFFSPKSDWWMKNKIIVEWRHPKFHNPVLLHCGASLIAHLGKNLPAVQETPVWFLGWEDTLEKEQATHSSILTWRIPWSV